VQRTARLDEARPRWLAAVLLWPIAAGRAAGGRRRRGAGERGGHGVQLGGHGNGKCRLGERAGEGREKERERVSGSS